MTIQLYRVALPVVFFNCIVNFPSSSSAQQKGQYLPGTTGLNTGIQSAPGFTYANISTFYIADRLKTRNGTYSAHAIGPDVEFIMPHKMVNLFVRYQPEFGAKARVEGRTIVFGVGFTIPRNGAPPP